MSLFFMDNPANIMNSIQSLLTIAILTHNEERHLADCLASVAPLGCAVCVIDSGSTDKTIDIAQNQGASVHVFSDWQGFGVQRNRAHDVIETPYVFWLDADERLDETTRQDLIQHFEYFEKNELHEHHQKLFSINRLSMVYGREIRHSGWYPDRVIRIYPIDFTRYNENLVHESVIIPENAQIIELKGNVLHYTYADLSQHLAKMQKYAWAWAEQNYLKKQSNPYSATARAIFAFIRFYFLKQGFRDGKAGVMIAMMNAIYTFLKYAQLWQLNSLSEKKH